MQQWSSAHRFGGSKWSTRQQLEEEQDATEKRGRRELQYFPSISNQKKEQGQNTLKQLHKKSETKEHLLTSLAPKTCQIKDNMQMRVPL